MCPISLTRHSARRLEQNKPLLQVALPLVSPMNLPYSDPRTHRQRVPVSQTERMALDCDGPSGHPTDPDLRIRILSHRLDARH